MHCLKTFAKNILPNWFILRIFLSINDNKLAQKGVKGTVSNLRIMALLKYTYLVSNIKLTPCTSKWIFQFLLLSSQHRIATTNTAGCTVQTKNMYLKPKVHFKYHLSFWRRPSISICFSFQLFLLKNNQNWDRSHFWIDLIWSWS